MSSATIGRQRAAPPPPSACGRARAPDRHQLRCCRIGSNGGRGPLRAGRGAVPLLALHRRGP
eukprot:5712180-Lingulodinium_polyedra.AAC.1